LDLCGYGYGSLIFDMDIFQERHGLIWMDMRNEATCFGFGDVFREFRVQTNGTSSNLK
jgi:hypothetical protein